MNVRRVIVAAILAVAVCSTARSAVVQAQVSDASAVDAAFKKAFLAGDLDGLFALYAPDAVSTEPFGVFTSSEAAKAGTAAFIQKNPGFRASISESTVSLDTAVHRVAVTSDPIRAAGVSRIWVIRTMVVSQGKIVAFAAVLDLSDAETLRYAMAAGG